jgi:hypothetical protein
MRKSVLSVLGVALALLPGCGTSGAVAPPTALDSEYALESINGISLPYLKAATVSERIEVVSGFLMLRPDGTYSGEIIERATTDSDAQFHPEPSSGTYRVSGNTLTFTVTVGRPRQGAVYTGTRDGARISTTLNDVTFVFVEK